MDPPPDVVRDTPFPIVVVVVAWSLRFIRSTALVAAMRAPWSGVVRGVAAVSDEPLAPDGGVVVQGDDGKGVGVVVADVGTLPPPPARSRLAANSDCGPVARLRETSVATVSPVAVVAPACRLDVDPSLVPGGAVALLFPFAVLTLAAPALLKVPREAGSSGCAWFGAGSVLVTDMTGKPRTVSSKLWFAGPGAGTTGFGVLSPAGSETDTRT